MFSKKTVISAVALAFSTLPALPAKADNADYSRNGEPTASQIQSAKEANIAFRVVLGSVLAIAAATALAKRASRDS